MYIGTKTETKRIHEIANARWEYAVCLSPVDEFTQVSFVNGVYTSKGGKHVDYLLKKIINKHRDKLLIPYSHAHINDKQQSKDTHADLFWLDIDFFSEFSQEKILLYNKEKGEARSGVGNAREVYKNLESRFCFS